MKPTTRPQSWTTPRNVRLHPARQHKPRLQTNINCNLPRDARTELMRRPKQNADRASTSFASSPSSRSVVLKCANRLSPALSPSPAMLDGVNKPDGFRCRVDSFPTGEDMTTKGKNEWFVPPHKTTREQPNTRRGCHITSAKHTRAYRGGEVLLAPKYREKRCVGASTSPTSVGVSLPGLPGLRAQLNRVR
jgi:hypothetical protein